MSTFTISKRPKCFSLFMFSCWPIFFPLKKAKFFTFFYNRVKKFFFFCPFPFFSITGNIFNFKYKFVFVISVCKTQEWEIKIGNDIKRNATKANSQIKTNQCSLCFLFRVTSLLSITLLYFIHNNHYFLSLLPFLLGNFC